MQFLRIENASKSYGEKILFKDINLNISQGDRIGLVAKNGSGKTTLLNVIAGTDTVEGETSSILLNKDIAIYYLQQDPQLSPTSTVFDEVYSSDNENLNAIRNYELALQSKDQERIDATYQIVDRLHAWNVEVEIKELISRFNVGHLDAEVGSLSGGQKKRLALIKLIIANPDFLILDEPTNHLDIVMIEWLENYLEKASRTLFMVTHDRYFLERVCNEILELDKGNLYSYKGNYTDFLEKRMTRIQNERIEKDKYVKLYKKELDWINRQPKARGTKAKSRVSNFQGIKSEAFKNLDDKELILSIESSRLGSKILELYNVEKAYDDLVLVHDFSYKFKKGEKVGIIGNNGTGKTTLIRMMMKDLKPDVGRVVVGETVVFGHYNQEGLLLDTDKRVIDVIRDIAEYLPMPKGQKLTAEQLLERFMFPRPQQQVYVSRLSGGERRRLLLLTVLMKNPNFLILDEPTNDLDILTLNVLEEYLNQFKGCVIIVSHDRFFMDKLTDHLFVLEGNGAIRDYNGNYTQYRESGKKNNVHVSTTPDVKVKSEVPDAVKVKRKLSYHEQREIEAIEKELDDLEERKKEISSRFHDETLSGTKINELSQELSKIQSEIENKELGWMEIQESIDEVMNSK